MIKWLQLLLIVLILLILADFVRGQGKTIDKSRRRIIRAPSHTIQVMQAEQRPLYYYDYRVYNFPAKGRIRFTDRKSRRQSQRRLRLLISPTH